MNCSKQTNIRSDYFLSRVGNYISIDYRYPIFYWYLPYVLRSQEFDISPTFASGFENAQENVLKFIVLFLMREKLH